MNTTRWQNSLIAIMGVWLIMSPLVLGFQDLQLPMRNSVFAGIAILIVAAPAIDFPETWEELLSVLLGMWLISSPLILGFQGLAVALYNSVIVGSAVVILALWATFLDQGFQHWRHSHHLHS
jgi:SPW repeat